MSIIPLELEQTDIDFLNDHKFFGFKDNSAMLKEALKRLKNELELKRMRESIDLHTQIVVERAEIDESFEYLFK